MIEVTKLDSRRILMNEDYIMTVEETPDTVVTLSDGHRLLLKESLQEIMDKIIAFRKL